MLMILPHDPSLWPRYVNRLEFFNFSHLSVLVEYDCQSILPLTGQSVQGLEKNKKNVCQNQFCQPCFSNGGNYKTDILLIRLLNLNIH